MTYETATVIPAFNEEKQIGRTLIHLSLSARPPQALIPVVVVDNGSTDNTRQVIEDSRILQGLDIHVVSEPEKGTGSAADSGFRYAIEELQAQYIGRIDADTRPMPFWFAAFHARHKSDPKAHLLTGPVWRGYDVPDRARDIYLQNSVVPIARTATRVIRALKYRSPSFLKFAPGYNMSTTREAYLETGGFPRSGILEKDEDVAYNALIAQVYGRKAVKFERGMEVFVSPRRLRNMGYTRAALHYASTRNRSTDGIDRR